MTETPAASAAPSHDPNQILWLNVAILTLLPLAALASTIWYAATHGIGWQEWVALIVTWYATGLGITVGYHRLFSHRTYKAHPAVRVLLSFLGAAAAQNSVIAWSSDHRRHHAYVDTDKDPYNARRGFWFSHMGWVMRQGVWGDGNHSNVSDLQKDPVLRFQHDHYLAVALGVNLLLVGVAGALTGRWLGMLIVAGLLRVVLVQHATFCINSLAHIFGSQRWSHANTARDSWWLSLITMGEGYHNFHHAFEGDYRNGVLWYAFDPSKWSIWTLSLLGLTTDLKRTPEDRVLRRRFEEGRSTLSARMELWGEAKAEIWVQRMVQGRDDLLARFQALRDQLQSNQLDVGEQAEALEARIREGLADLRGQLAAQAEELRAQALRQIEEAEAALEAALEELQTSRLAFSKALRSKAEAGRAELRELKDRFKSSRRAARQAMRGWEAAIERYRIQFEAIPHAA